MRESADERAVMLGEYILETGATVRAVGKNAENYYLSSVTGVFLIGLTHKSA